MIPFNEYFLIFYTGWYLLVAGSLAYYFFYDVQRFKELDLYIFVTQVVAMAIYILFPSRQDLRPAVFPRENFFTWVMGLIYTLDTDTGVCPSLHVAYSLVIFNVIVKDRDVHKWVKWFVGIFAACVCASTMFVKQHSFLDFLAALPVVLLGECIIYGKSYWLPRFKKQKVS